jgi:hypothetical protein
LQQAGNRLADVAGAKQGDAQGFLSVSGSSLLAV